jgi:hypothetical protein
MPTPTFVPTYVPVAGIPLAVTPTPYAVPTSSFDGSNAPTAEEDNTGFIILTIALVCVCLLFLLILGVVILTFVVRSQKAGKNG